MAIPRRVSVPVTIGTTLMLLALGVWLISQGRSLGWFAVGGALLSDAFLIWGFVTRDPKRKDLLLGRKDPREREPEGEPDQA